jgi:hypothetical protein
MCTKVNQTQNQIRIRATLPTSCNVGEVKSNIQITETKIKEEYRTQ